MIVQSEKIRKISTIVITVLFAAIPLSLAFNNNICLDEGFSLGWSVRPFGAMMWQLIHDVHPPLYYFMLRVVLFLTGKSLLAAKLFSVLALWLIFVLGATFVKKHFGMKAMLFFDLFILCTPMMLAKAVEIRMYTWAYLAVLCSVIQMYYLLGKAYTGKNWVLFTASALAAAYLHYFALLAMVVVYGTMLIWFILQKDLKQIKGWLVCSLVTIIGYLPWLPTALAQVKAGGVGWITMPSSRLGLIRELFTTSFHFTENIYIVLMMAFILFGLVLLWKHRSYEIYWALACMSILWIELIFGLVYGSLFQPIMISRYLMIPLCTSLLGMACLCKYIPKYVLFLPAFLFLITVADTYPKVFAEEYNPITGETLEFARTYIKEGDIILFNSGELSSVIPYFFPECVGLTGDIYEGDYAYLWYFDTYQTLDLERLTENNIAYERYGDYGFDNVPFVIYYIYPLSEEGGAVNE